VRIEIRNTLVADLGNELIGAIEVLFGGQRAALALRSLGGAVARVPADATAFAHRDAEVMLVTAMVLPADATPSQAAEALAWWDLLAAQGSGAYVNFLGSASEADVAAVYPPATYQRLAAVKRAYDPGNVFRRNHNIRPS
jgi:FAD/FMN-containing dehydrogenase